MSATGDLRPPEGALLFEERIEDPWQEPQRDRAPLDAALMLMLTMVAVILTLTVTAIVVFRSPLSDLVALPGRIVAGLGS